MLPADLMRIRNEWFTAVASRMVPEHLDRYPGLSKLGLYDGAVVVLGVGVGHLLGIDDVDLTFGAALSSDEVSALIADCWRTGDVDPDVAAWLLPSFQSMVWVAKSMGPSESSPLGWFTTSHLRNRVNVHFEQFDADFSAQLERLCEDVPPCASLTELFAVLIAKHSVPAVLSALTPLETRFLGPDPVRDYARGLLADVHLDRHYSLSSKGAWPDRAQAETPLWVRDTVTLRGARIFHSSSGYVPSIMIVAETDEDERALQQWTYNPRMGSELVSDKSLTLYVVLDYPDGPGYLPLSFNYENHESLQRLEVFLAVRMLRLEVYRLLEDGDVVHKWNFGVPFTSEFDHLVAHHRSRSAPKPQRFPASATDDEMLLMMQARQRALFESVLPPGSRQPPSEIASAWEWRLQILRDSADRKSQGRPIDHALLAESHAAVRSAEAGVPRADLEPLALATLGPRRALLQLVAEVSNQRISAAIAYLDGSGQPRARSVDLSHIRLDSQFSSYRELSRYFVEGLGVEMKHLLGEGIVDLVLSVGPGIYNVPFHDALLELGFASVSYAHSLDVLDCHPPNPGTVEAIVIGHPGTGGQYLTAVDAELGLVRELTRSEPADTVPEVLPGLVHVAGHGVTGKREYEVGIELGPAGGFLSGPRILEQIDASATKVAYLSACSTGAGMYQPGNQIRAVPMDVALLEKGCTAVISTSDAVNDYVAIVFAAVFHHRFASGESIWSSYAAARAAFINNPPDVPLALHSALDQRFPKWRASVPDDQHETWRLFRLSGRHWT